jgi:hypothetical protein
MTVLSWWNASPDGMLSIRHILIPASSPRVSAELQELDFHFSFIGNNHHSQRNPAHVPEKWHRTMSLAVRLWQYDQARRLSTPHLTTNQQVRVLQEHFALWHA